MDTKYKYVQDEFLLKKKKKKKKYFQNKFL